ncbi:MAG TPA: efflux RND transporter permease subunit, partial [Gemmatimonadaceae bacterium]|nr:efflux RND transporter permease subunit [Gemmatimonadaceae bacterium]
IGMIALAGIIVRNSILLVDFIQLAEERGRSLREAVLEAGAVRFRPIALTAAAVVVGGLVMVLDPIFQGLAVALMSGAVVATLLTMVVVPLLYWELRQRELVRIPLTQVTPCATTPSFAASQAPSFSDRSLSATGSTRRGSSSRHSSAST